MCTQAGRGHQRQPTCVCARGSSTATGSAWRQHEAALAHEAAPKQRPARRAPCPLPTSPPSRQFPSTCWYTCRNSPPIPSQAISARPNRAWAAFGARGRPGGAARRQVGREGSFYRRETPPGSVVGAPGRGRGAGRARSGAKHARLLPLPTPTRHSARQAVGVRGHAHSCCAGHTILGKHCLPLASYVCSSRHATVQAATPEIVF